MKKLNFAFFVGDEFYPPYDPSIIEFIEQDSNYQPTIDLLNYTDHYDQYDLIFKIKVSPT